MNRVDTWCESCRMHHPKHVAEDDLLDAIDHLWSELPVETVKEIERELPGLAALCQHAHHRMSHEQRMVRVPSWAAVDVQGEVT